jgi:hypothetical protein
MTLVVAWYREKFGQLWVAADTRISGGPGVITDHGPKIFQIPVVCFKNLKEDRPLERLYRTNYGFAFAGSTISALGTHALASACTQNLSSLTKIKPPSLNDVAALYKKAGEVQVREICVRYPPSEWHHFFFDAFVFGFCLVRKRFEARALACRIAGGRFEIVLASMTIAPKLYHPMGSGADEFVERMEKENKAGSGRGVFPVLGQMVRDGSDKTVGGHTQVGVADSRTGVRLPPVLVLADDKANVGSTTFLGVDVDEFGEVGGFHIGYWAIGPDDDEMKEHAERIGKK